MEYLDFKSIISVKNLAIQFEKQIINNEIGYVYYLYSYDGPIKYECAVSSSDDITDFENNYKENSNKAIDVRDVGTGLLKVRPRDVEGILALVFVYFKTGDITSLDSSNNPDFSISIHTSTGLSKTSTYIDYNPKFGYYITGGIFKPIEQIPVSNFIIINFIFSPDLPPIYGGNWYFINNKRVYTNNDTLDITVPSKYVKYYPEFPSANKLRLQVVHDTILSIECEFTLKLFI